MAKLVKRWYRSRRNQVLLICVMTLGFMYYASLKKEESKVLDTFVVNSNAFTAYNTAQKLSFAQKDFRKITSELTLIPELEDFSNSEKTEVIKLYQHSLDYRSSVSEYIERRLQEALKLDKGSGCEMPILDPFAKEVTQLEKVLPKVDCESRDWVRCYLSECRVVQKILDETSDIVCTYRDILYESDAKYTIGRPVDVKGADIYTLTKSDHVKVKCVGQHHNSMRRSKWTGHSIGFRISVERKPSPRGREDSLNVLIFGFDSTSKNGFIRMMPKSYAYLVNELGGIVLDSYNVVGDGTPAALFPILTGKTELELPDVRKKAKSNTTCDVMPFLFYRLKDDGYRTAYFEDMPWIGTFQYRFNGFKKQPADHYLRAFYLEESNGGKKWWSPSQKKYCVGERPQYKLMQDITDQFFDLDGKKFGFTFIADITHNDISMISTADDDTLEFLKNFKEKGRFEDTMVFLMGDHGPRFARIRDTLQGKFEERLPFMCLLVPPSLAKSRPSLMSNLRANTRVLTTPHDIHATLLDALGLPNREVYKVPGADLPRGMSLFEPIPRNRSCSEASIEPHWCACLKWISVPTSDPMYRKVADAIMNFINSLTEPVRSKCIPRNLLSVVWVMRQVASKGMLSFVEAKDADGYVGKFSDKQKKYNDNYQIKFIVGPGKGVYEASMTYLVKENRFTVDTRDISRTNAYNDEPHCISATHPHLNMYCYCND